MFTEKERGRLNADLSAAPLPFFTEVAAGISIFRLRKGIDQVPKFLGIKNLNVC
jgi:hypothetical protein